MDQASPGIQKHGEASKPRAARDPRSLPETVWSAMAEPKIVWGRLTRPRSKERYICRRHCSLRLLAHQSSSTLSFTTFASALTLCSFFLTLLTTSFQHRRLSSPPDNQQFNMRFFATIAALALAATVSAQSTETSSVAASITSASLTPEQTCLAACTLLGRSTR